MREDASNRKNIFPFIFCWRGLLPSLLGGVQIPVTRSNREGTPIGVPSLLERIMVKRHRRKLPVTFSLALSWCSLLLGFAERGSDSRYSLQQRRDTSRCPFSIGVSNRCENSPQAASNLLLSTLLVQLASELARRGSDAHFRAFSISSNLNRIILRKNIEIFLKKLYNDSIKLT